MCNIKFGLKTIRFVNVLLTLLQMIFLLFLPFSFQRHFWMQFTHSQTVCFCMRTLREELTILLEPKSTKAFIDCGYMVHALLLFYVYVQLSVIGHLNHKLMYSGHKTSLACYNQYSQNLNLYKVYFTINYYLYFNS